MKQYNHKRGITLLELIITIALLSTVVLAVGTIDKFSHYQVIDSDRKAKLQNEISYTLEHMTKEISKAVGNRAIAYPNPNHNPINNDTILGDIAIKAYIDSNATGGPGNGQWGTTDGDHWIAYLLHNDTTQPEDYQIWYCPNCTAAACSNCTTGWGNSTNIIGRRIKEFTPADNPTSNYMDIGITARWQPVEENATVDNPGVTLRTRIKMPSVATN